MVISIDQVKNEFKIWRAKDEFILSRNIQEVICPSDLIELSDSIQRQIDAMEKELKNLKDKKTQFDMWIDTAKVIRERELNEGLKQMKSIKYETE